LDEVEAEVVDAPACALLVDVVAGGPGTVLRPVVPVTRLGSPAGDPAAVVENEVCGLLDDDGGGNCALDPAIGGEGTRLGGEAGGKFEPPPPPADKSGGAGGDCSVLTSRLIEVEVDLMVSPKRSSTRLALRTDVNDSAISAPGLGEGLAAPPVPPGRGTNPSPLFILCILSG